MGIQSEEKDNGIGTEEHRKAREILESILSMKTQESG